MKKEKPKAVFTVIDGMGNTLRMPPIAALSSSRTVLSHTWIPSRFNISVDMPEGHKAVFNSATGATILLQEQVWRQGLGKGVQHIVSSGGAIPEALQMLHSKGFLVSADVDELDLVRVHYLSSRYQEDLLGINVVPTMACNLQCPYCFEGKAQEMLSQKKISRKTEDAIVQYILNLSRGKRTIHVVWFGGEPLLAVGSIERISLKLISAFKKARIKYVQTLVTNGTLLSRSVVQRLAKSRISFAQVTVDIPKETKRDWQGRDTLEKVLDNMALAAEKIKVYLRINIIHDDEAEFDNLYQGLIQRNLHKKLKTIMMAHVLEPECGRSGCNFHRTPPGVFVEVGRRERIKARNLKLPMEQLPSSPNGACAATCQSSAVIAPDGLVYKCVEDLGLADRAYSSVFESQRVKSSNLIPWMTYDWFKYEICRKCPMLPQCAGGCPHKRIFQSDTWKSEDFCYWHICGDLENRIREQVSPLFSP